MGYHPNVGFDRFPTQGDWLNVEVEVVFDYDTSQRVTGRIVRDDVEDPGLLVISLADGRVVLSTECQYQRKKSDTA